MDKRNILLLFVGVILFMPTLACGAVGVYNPEATQAAMQGTVVALQETITALEGNIGQNQSDEPQVIVVTATATPTPQVAGSSTVVAASSLGQTILTPTPTPTPVDISPQDKVVTLVATFTPTPTPKSYPNAPVLIEPREGTVVEEGREILLHWSWNGVLGPNEHFDIKIRPDGQNRSAYVAWEEGAGHDFTANLAPGRYYWSVQIVQGYYKDNIKEPENRIFEAFLSPESEPRLIIVAERDDDPTPTPTPRPDLNGNEDTGDAAAPEEETTPDASSGDGDGDTGDNGSEENNSGTNGDESN